MVALAGSSSHGVGNKEDGCALILEPPQNFRVTWDHWQTDLGLAYIVRLVLLPQLSRVYDMGVSEDL